MDEHSARILDEVVKDLHLTKHRITVLEQEQLPRRVASMEPVVQRLENKVDNLHDQVEKGFREVRESMVSQKAIQKGAATIIIVVVGAIQLIPVIQGLMK